MEIKNGVSLVVPMYKVEKYLHGCIDSVLNQTFQNFELILVNDGSPDKCGEIADEYAANDNRIKVIHKQNGGTSSARNAGIEMASGKYIVFIDSDDALSSEYLTTLYNAAEKDNCDAVVSGYQEVPTNRQVVASFKLNTVLNGRDFILSSSNVHSGNDLCFSWRFMFKLELIKQKQIRYDEKISVAEDTAFNMEYILESERVICIPDILYYYTINNMESVMKTPYKANLENSLILQYAIRKNLSIKFGLFDNTSYRKDMANYYLSSILRMLTNNLKNKSGANKKEEFLKMLRFEMFSDAFKEIGFSYKCNNIKEYIYYLALKFKFSPLITRDFQ